MQEAFTSLLTRRIGALGFLRKTNRICGGKYYWLRPQNRFERLEECAHSRV